MSAARKWLALTVDILAYETEHWSDGELLSQACDGWIEKHPVLARGVIVSVGLLLTAHLANLLNDRHDALSLMFWRRNCDLLPYLLGKRRHSPPGEMRLVSLST